MAANLWCKTEEANGSLNLSCSAACAGLCSLQAALSDAKIPKVEVVPGDDPTGGDYAASQLIAACLHAAQFRLPS